MKTHSPSKYPTLLTTAPHPLPSRTPRTSGSRLQRFTSTYVVLHIPQALIHLRKTSGVLRASVLESVCAWLPRQKKWHVTYRNHDNYRKISLSDNEQWPISKDQIRESSARTIVDISLSPSFLQSLILFCSDLQVQIPVLLCACAGRCESLWPAN